MCDVYQNAFLNISADHAVDARGGCFRDRYFGTVDAFKLQMKPVQGSYWVSVDERNLFEWVKTAPSSERAWIFQERHLARRILHFTEQEVFWECRAASPSFRSEIYPQGSPLPRDFLGQTKLPLQDTSTKSIVDDLQLESAWDAACRGYSQRKLTYQTDKLPALSGLARHFGSRCRDDTYVAGMWLSQLPHALFWNVPVRGRPDVRPPSTDIPSWSWLSCAGPVEPSKVGSLHYFVDIATILPDYQHKTTDQYGDLARAHIQVYGFMRRITSVMKRMNDDPDADAYRGASHLGSSKNYRHLYVDGQLEHDIGYGTTWLQQFGEAPDWFHGFEPVEYDCLFLTVSQDGPLDDYVLRGLLLEAADEEGGYRRVGQIWFRSRCALRMRYQLQAGIVDEQGAWDQLWELVAPYWGEVERDVERGREPTGPIVMDREIRGPEALYELDGDVAEDAGFVKLEPQLVTLV
ncbi:MAG: hypothetical protein Q9170_001950 [Blastenia crenularia]